MQNNIEILVLDSNKEDRDRLIAKLKEPGYTIVGLRKSKDLFTRLSKSDIQFAIVDLTVDDMEPFELIKKIKERHPQTKLITITDNPSSAFRKKVARAGVLFHSTKPKHLYQLKQIIKVTLEFHVRKEQRLVM